MRSKFGKKPRHSVDVVGSTEAIELTCQYLPVGSSYATITAVGAACLLKDECRTHFGTLGTIFDTDICDLLESNTTILCNVVATWFWGWDETSTTTYVDVPDYSVFDQDAFMIAQLFQSIFDGTESILTGLGNIESILGDVLGVGVGGGQPPAMRVSMDYGSTEDIIAEGILDVIIALFNAGGVDDEGGLGSSDSVGLRAGPVFPRGIGVSNPNFPYVKFFYHASIHYYGSINEHRSAFPSDSIYADNGGYVRSQENAPSDRVWRTIPLGPVLSTTYVSPQSLWSEVVSSSNSYSTAESTQTTYCLFPEWNMHLNPFVPCIGNNSNSFIRGLLNSTDSYLIPISIAPLVFLNFGDPDIFPGTLTPIDSSLF